MPGGAGRDSWAFTRRFGTATLTADRESACGQASEQVLRPSGRTGGPCRGGAGAVPGRPGAGRPRRAAVAHDRSARLGHASYAPGGPCGPRPGGGRPPCEMLRAAAGCLPTVTR
ncbi:hypothetical protein C2142_29445 [Streptomyces sp. CB01881]|nr:hypothetical protein C2142_29445 [Streptomyces sp. CB01881]